MSMYAECPNCHAIFRVTPEILTQANGSVRCGECHQVFRAAVEAPSSPESVVEYAPEGEFVTDDEAPAPIDVEDLEYTDETSEPEHDDIIIADGSEDTEEPGDEAPHNGLTSTKQDEAWLYGGSDNHAIEKEPVEAPTESEKTEPPQTELFAVDEQEPSSEPPLNESEEQADTPAPTTPPQRTAPSIWQNTSVLALLSLLFLALLGGQYLYKNRYELGQIPSMRPILEQLCQVTGCDLPPQVALSKLELLNHGIYSHPNVKDALMIKAVIVNHAAFEQPLPIIELSLSNIRGEKIALRRFGPAEYLSETDTQETGLMAPDRQINISLQVKDPGKDALAFEFEFL